LQRNYLLRSPMCEWRILGKPFGHYAYPRPDTSRPWSRKSQRRKEPVLWNEIPFFLRNSTKWKTHPCEGTLAIELLLFHERGEHREKDIENTHCKTSYSASTLRSARAKVARIFPLFRTYLTSWHSRIYTGSSLTARNLFYYSRNCRILNLVNESINM